jgi:tRNA-2-methylthio-N6-dimethylallyladenosine synthase
VQRVQTPLDKFAREVVDALKAKGPVDWQQTDEDGRTPLHYAAKSNNAFIIKAAITEGSLAFNHGTIGRRCKVLLERPGRKPGQLIGKTPWLQSAVVSIPGACIGDIVEVEITGAMPNSVETRPINPPSSESVAA